MGTSIGHFAGHNICIFEHFCLTKEVRFRDEKIPAIGRFSSLYIKKEYIIFFYSNFYLVLHKMLHIQKCYFNNYSQCKRKCFSKYI